MRYLVITCAIILIPALAAANGYETYPAPLAWSPDSQYLAVVALNDFDGYTHSGDLVIYDKYNRVVHDYGPGFSSPGFPDGDRLAVVNHGEIWLIETGDWDNYETIIDTEVLDCRWMSDGAGGGVLIYTSGSRFGDADIMATTGSFSESAAITTTGDLAAATGPVGSPGGTYIAYTRTPGDIGLFGYERLWLYATETGETWKAAPEQAREWDYHESNPVFTPGGEVIFQRGGWGDWHLYRRNLETGGELIEITDAQQPSVSRDGRFLAFTRRDPDEKAVVEYDWEISPSVWVYNRERLSGGRQVSVAGVYAEHPAVSPNGQKLAWLEGEGENIKLQMRSLIGQID